MRNIHQSELNFIKCSNIHKLFENSDVKYDSLRSSKTSNSNACADIRRNRSKYRHPQKCSYSTSDVCEHIHAESWRPVWRKFHVAERAVDRSGPLPSAADMSRSPDRKFCRTHLRPPVTGTYAAIGIINSIFVNIPLFRYTEYLAVTWHSKNSNRLAKNVLSSSVFTF